MAVEPVPRRLTTSEFDALVRAGHWDEDDRVELLDGQVVVMSPVGDRHAYLVGLLDDLLREVYGWEVKVWQQQPLRLPPYDEPVPDVALLRRRADNYRALPEGDDVLLVIEVADTSLQRDRDTKARVYAASGIPEYWVVDLNGEVVWLHRAAGPGQYQVRSAARRGEVLRAEFNPSRALRVDDLLP